MSTQQALTVTNDRYRLDYHLMTPGGWMNDPNGFCYFKGYYHIFYQFYPYAAEWGPMHWGHARSRDLVNWENLPIALTPGDPEDKDGCFSGSAIVKDDKLYLVYTGHHYYGDNDPDHFWQNQNVAISTDGVHFTKYADNPVIAAAPDDNTHHFRDPKVWQDGDDYYMILGSQNKAGNGRVILYQSTDLLKWDYLGPIATATDAKTEGFMWECPDLFTLDNKQILLTSPQGIPANGKQYRNLYQTGYMVGQLDVTKPELVDRTAFTELDHGHDFYATQTTLAPDGRCLVFGWLAMWESNMPEQADGWAGALTFPRELNLRDGHLYMTPARELANLRDQVIADQDFTGSTDIDLAEAPAQLEITADYQLASSVVPVSFRYMNATGESVVELQYNPASGELKLTRNDRSDARYATVHPGTELHLQVLVDTSSMELFVNDGEAVFSERFYDVQAKHLFTAAAPAVTGHVTITTLKTNQPN